MVESGRMRKQANRLRRTYPLVQTAGSVWRRGWSVRGWGASGFALRTPVRAGRRAAAAFLGARSAAGAFGVSGHDWRIAACLCLALNCVYLFTFSGVFRSIDELALFSVTESLVQSGRTEPLLVAFAPYHNPVGLFESGYPLLAVPLYWLAGQWQPVSNVHAVMLLNPWLTAATAGLLYVFARRLGYDGRASLAVGLAWGLASMAWPYTKSFLREPAVALLWTVAFLGTALFMDAPRWPAAVLSLAPAVLAVGVKAASVVAWPVLLGLMLWSLYRGRRISRAWLLALIVGSVGAAVAAGLILLALRGHDAANLLAGLLASPFDQSSLLAVYGLLLSPGKSVFVYSPVLLVAVAGWPSFYRRHPQLAVALVCLWVLLLFSLRISVWTGGLTWGPRFLLPLLPLSLLPALELLTRRTWALAVALVSAAFQATVALVDWSTPYQFLAGRYPGLDPDLAVGLDWSHLAESPAVLALRLWGRSGLDLLWLQAGLAGDVKLDAGLGLGLAAAIVIAGVALLLTWQDRRAGWALGVGLAVTLLAGLGLLWRGYWSLPDYPGLSAATARRLAGRVSTDGFSPALVVNVSPDFGTYGWLGLIKGAARRAWVSPAQTEPFDALLPDQAGARVYVVVDRPHIASHYPGDLLVSWMNGRAYRVGSDWIDGFELVGYAALSNTGRPVTARYTWPTGVALIEFAVPETVEVGGVLPLDLVLERVGASWSSGDRLFTNLVSEDGGLVFGQENELQYGHLAAAGWPTGIAARDRRGLWVPAEAPPGRYTLVVGFSNGQGYVPANLAHGETADYIALVDVVVSP